MFGPIGNRLLIVLSLMALMILQPGCRSEKSNKPPGHEEAGQAVKSPAEPNPNESAYETVLADL